MIKLQAATFRITVDATDWIDLRAETVL